MIRALEFTATTHPIQLPSMTEGFGSGILINVWVRRTGTGVRQRIVDMATAAGVHLFLGTGDQADTLTVGIEDATHRQEVVALGALPLNRWVKVTATVVAEFGTGFGNLRVFDIELAQGQTGVPGSGAFTDCKVGSGGRGKPFEGQLSNLEISRLQASGWGQPAKPPIQWAYYPLDKVAYSKTVTTNGVDVKYYAVDDTSINNHNALVQDELQAREFSSQTTGTIPVLALPGPQCIVRLSPLQSFTGALTLETWFKPTSVTAEQTLLRLCDDASVTLALTVGGGNTTSGFYNLNLTLYQGTTAISLVTSEPDAKAGVFQHLAVTISQGGLTSNKRVPITISLYLNGQLATTTTIMTSSLTTGSGTTTDGQQYLPLYRLLNSVVINNVLLSGEVGTSTYFTGQLSELRVWNVCRSAQEIGSYFLSRAIGNEPGLLACYRMEQRISKCIFDSSAAHGLGRALDDGTYVKFDGTILPKDFTIGTATNLPLLHTSNPADPHIVLKGKLTTEYMVYNTTSNSTVVSGQVTVYDATIEPVLPDGTSTAGKTVQLSMENDEWVYLDQDTHISQLTLWKAKQVYSVTVPIEGKIRLRFKAAYLSFTTLRLRFDDMPEGVWTMVRPDSENLANLGNLSGSSLVSPPSGKPSPLPAGTTLTNANLCADTLANIANCYRPATSTTVFGSPRSFWHKVTKTWKKTTDWTKDAVNTVGSTLQKAGSAAGQYANALVDDGSVVLSQAGAVVKDVGSLVCSTSTEYQDLLHAAETTVPRYGATKIAEAITSANRLAIVADDVAGGISHTISIIGTTVINGTTYVWRAVACGVWNAVTAMFNFLKKIGTDIQKMIQFLAWLFKWDDFLAASDGIYDDIKNRLDQVSATIKASSQYKDQIKSALVPPASVPTQSLSQLVGLDIPQNLRSKELDYVMELGYKLMRSPDLDIAGLTDLTNNVLSMLPSVDTARLESVASTVGTISSTVISSVLGLLTTPINQLVSGLVNVTDTVIDFLFDGVATLSDALVTAIAGLFTGHINIPYVTIWIETTILGGRPLNLLRLISLAGAIVQVQVAKISAAADSGNAEPQVVSFTDSTSQTQTDLLYANFSLSLALTFIEALHLFMEMQWERKPVSPGSPDPNAPLRFAFEAMSGVFIIVRSGLNFAANATMPMKVRVLMDSQATFELTAGIAQILFGGFRCAFSDGKNASWLTATNVLDLLCQSGFGAVGIVTSSVAGSFKDQFPNHLAWVSYGCQSCAQVCAQSALWMGAFVDYKPEVVGNIGPQLAFGLRVGTLGWDLGAAITGYQSNQVSSS